MQGGAGDWFRRDATWWILVIGPPILVFSIIGWLLFRDRRRRRAEEADAFERAPPLARADGDVPARRTPPRTARSSRYRWTRRSRSLFSLTRSPACHGTGHRHVAGHAVEQKNQPCFCSNRWFRCQHYTRAPLERRHAGRDADLVHGARVARVRQGVGARDGRLERRDGARLTMAPAAPLSPPPSMRSP